MKKYILVVTKNKDGFRFTSKAVGFNGLEIVGMLSMKIDDLRKQAEGLVEPRIFDRIRVKETKQ